MTDKKTHSKYGASTSKRWMSCNGSPRLIAKAPPPVESKYALEGTNAHTCLERILKADNQSRVRKFLLTKYPAKMVSHAEETANTILEWKPEGAILLTETEVDSSHFTRPDHHGTVDSAIANEFIDLHVIDYKYGAGIPVDPEENTQGIYYALALAKQFHYNFVDVKISIIQPRAFHTRGPVRTWHTTMKELLPWEDKFRAAVDACERPNAPLNPGKEWCRFCPAQVICPAYKDMPNFEAKLDFDEIPLIEQM